MMPAVEVANRTSFTIREGQVASLVRRVREKEKMGKGVISITFLTPSLMRSVSRTWHGKDEPSNVLSFPSREMKEWEAGEVLLCPFTVRKEARQRGVPFADHLKFLLLHGLLHCVGYAHGEKMETRERFWGKTLSRIRLMH